MVICVWTKIEKIVGGGDETYFQFACKRYLKLMFGYWFIFIPALIINLILKNSTYGEGNIYQKATNLLIDGLGLTNIFETPTLNVTWWYMSYALLLILITPLFLWLIEKAGYMVLPTVIIVPRYLQISDINRYLLALVLGSLCAKYFIFERIIDLQKRIKYIDIIFVSIASVILCVLRQRVGYYEIIEPILAMNICYFSVSVFAKFLIFLNVLSYVGKHSMNIFLTHTFIYYYFFSDFVYSFRFAGIIVIILLSCSLLLSIFIEHLKKFLKYDRLECKIIEYIEKSVIHE